MTSRILSIFARPNKSAIKQFCINAQCSDPILNYEFYLRLQKEKFEHQYENWPGPPVDERTKVFTEYQQQELLRWVYNPNVKMSIGFEQVEWITKSKVYLGRFTPSLEGTMKAMPEKEVTETVEDILRECYVFDTKDYDRPIKVPADPTDRWNPHFKDVYLEYPREERMVHNIFTNLLSYGLGSVNHSRNLVTFGCASQVRFERGQNSVLLTQPGGLTFLSEKPLPPECSTESGDEVSKTCEHNFANFYPLNPLLDFKNTNLYHNFDSFGVADKSANLMSYYPHTCFLPVTTTKKDRMKFAVCFVAFTNALAKCHQLYGAREQDLSTPIVSQCVASTGFDLHFATCQLNTTRFSDDDGIKNQIWVKANMPFFSSVKREFDLMVENYNKEAGSALFAHVVNGFPTNGDE